MPSGSGSILIWAICLTVFPNSVNGSKKVPAWGILPFCSTFICHKCLFSICRSASVNSRLDGLIIFLSTATAAITASCAISIPLTNAASSVFLYLNRRSNETEQLDCARTSRASVKAALVSSCSARISILSSVISTVAIRLSRVSAPLNTRSLTHRS